jgi:uncharacterized protein
MLKLIIVRTVVFCSRHPWGVILVCVALGVVAGQYAATHFAISTDIDRLIANNLPWTQRQIAFKSEFPERGITAVVEAPTPELATGATAGLVEALSKRTDVIRSISGADTGGFFERNGLLFLPPQDFARTIKGLTDAEPILETLCSRSQLARRAGRLVVRCHGGATR